MLPRHAAAPLPQRCKPLMTFSCKACVDLQAHRLLAAGPCRLHQPVQLHPCLCTKWAVCVNSKPCCHAACWEWWRASTASPCITTSIPCAAACCCTTNIPRYAHLLPAGLSEVNVRQGGPCKAAGLAAGAGGAAACTLCAHAIPYF